MLNKPYFPHFAQQPSFQHLHTNPDAHILYPLETSQYHHIQNQYQLTQTNQHLNNHQNQHQLQSIPTAEMQIDLGDGSNVQIIKVKNFHDPIILAQRFCYEHNLDAKVVNILAKNIKTFMQQAFGQQNEKDDVNNHKKKFNNSKKKANSYEQKFITSRQNSHNKQNKKNYLYQTLKNQAKTNQNNISFKQRQYHSTYSNKNSHRQTSLKTRFQNNRSLNNSPKSNQKLNTTTTTNNVFERLYNCKSKQKIDNLKKRQNHDRSTINKMSMSVGGLVKSKNGNQQINNGNNNFINNGILIYERNKRLAQQQQRKNHMKKLELLRNQQQAYLTFQPKINQISRLMIQKMKDFEQSQNIIERNKKNKMIKIQQIIRQRQDRENAACTFRPNINNKYNNISNRGNSTDRFNNLYEDSQTRISKYKKNVQDQKTQLIFQPQINTISQQMTKGIKFDQRLKKYQKQKLQKIQKLKKQLDSGKLDQNLQQAYFHPKIGRPPQKRNQQNLPVYLHLYKSAKHNDSVIIKNSINQNENIQHVIQNSEKMYQQRKILTIQNLFKLLDNDKDGIIGKSKIDMNKIQPDVLKLISPLINQMQQMNVDLEEDQFVHAIDRLFKTLNIQQKNLILNHNKKKKNLDEHSFKPCLNQKSLEMAKTLRKPMMNKTPGVGIYQYAKIKKQQKQCKIKEQRQKKTRQQLQQCTFQPILYTKKHGLRI